MYHSSLKSDCLAFLAKPPRPPSWRDFVSNNQHQRETSSPNGAGGSSCGSGAMDCSGGGGGVSGSSVVVVGGGSINSTTGGVDGTNSMEEISMSTGGMEFLSQVSQCSSSPYLQSSVHMTPHHQNKYQHHSRYHHHHHHLHSSHHPHNHNNHHHHHHHPSYHPHQQQQQQQQQHCNHQQLHRQYNQQLHPATGILVPPLQTVLDPMLTSATLVSPARAALSQRAKTFPQCTSILSYSNSTSSRQLLRRARAPPRIHRTRSHMVISERDLPSDTLMVTLAETKPEEFGLSSHSNVQDERVYLEENARRCLNWLDSIKACEPLDDIVSSPPSLLPPVTTSPSPFITTDGDNFGNVSSQQPVTVFSAEDCPTSLRICRGDGKVCEGSATSSNFSNGSTSDIGDNDVTNSRDSRFKENLNHGNMMALSANIAVNNPNTVSFCEAGAKVMRRLPSSEKQQALSLGKYPDAKVLQSVAVNMDSISGGDGIGCEHSYVFSEDIQRHQQQHQQQQKALSFGADFSATLESCKDETMPEERGGSRELLTNRLDYSCNRSQSSSSNSRGTLKALNYDIFTEGTTTAKWGQLPVVTRQITDLK